MDLKALQNRLRRFAAEREWDAYHTPKNLAMALTVEAAELAEIFQWLTPEQSSLARGDAVLQERVADELADVLLYLAQIADRTGVDLESAVEHKLVKNARKYPAAPVMLPLAGGNESPPAPQVHVLVDWENVQPKEGDVRALVPEATHLWLFHGPSQKNVGAEHTSFGAQATPVPIARAGKNSLDFHLSFDLGYLAARQPGARFVVLSNDKGYAPMLEHARQLGFDTAQMSFGGRKPRTATAKTPAGKKVAAKKTSARSKPAATKVAAPTAAKTTASRKVAAKKSPAAAKPTAKKAAAPAPAPAKRATPAKRAASPRAAAPVQRVLADLVRMSVDRRPTKQARLLAYIGSQLGTNADDPAAQGVLAELIESGLVARNSRGELQYRL